MAQDSRYEFSPEYRRALEALPHALAAYQYVNGSVITLLVSDGMCRLTGRSREALTQRLNEDMFSSVHPDDLEMLAKLGYEFSTKECVYDVVYRTRLITNEDYRVMHVVGKHQSREDGARTAMLVYTDVTDTPHHQLQALSRIESPKSHFFDENMSAMAIVSREDNRLLYYNKALTRLLPPKSIFDSGITFDRFFFGKESIHISRLYHAIDAGPRLTTDPLTNRKLEVNVLSTNFGGEAAYVIYFYEQQSMTEPGSITEPGFIEAAMRHKRASFNTAIFSSESNGLTYRDGTYKGFRVWNLTQNISSYQAGCTELFPASGADATLERYLDTIRALIDDAEVRESISWLNRDELMLLFESGTYPRQHTLPLSNERGTAYLSFRITLIRSPDSADLFLKIDEENVTDKTVIDMLVTKTVEQVYDYVAYSDLSADRCHIISGKAGASGKRSYTIKTSDFIHTPGDIRTFPMLFPPHVRTLEDMHEYLLSVCDEQGRYSSLQELSGGIFKNIYFELIDRERKTFYIRCKDVTSLLRAERAQKEELEQAVLTERARAEHIQLQTVLSISNALDARDPLTCSHSQRVAQYSTEIAKRIGWTAERVDNLHHIALVHDIGKIGVSDAVLQKNGQLTDEEYLHIQSHVAIGGFILKDFSAIDKVSEGALYHHERYDGKGYLRGLAGEEIPIEARIICVADALDAMHSSRPYRARQTDAYICAELKRERGKQFDPMLVDMLLEMIDEGLLEQS